MVPHGGAVPQTARIAPACAPFVQGLPRAPGRFHGDQDTLTPLVVQGGLEGRCKAPAALPGVGKCARTTAPAGRRPQTGTVLGFAHLDSNEEQGRLVSLRFPLVRGSSILWQSHGTLLRVG